MAYRNGTPPAPQTKSGVVAYVQGRTEFLPDLPANSGLALVYQLSRQQIASFPLTRWAIVIIGACGLLWPLFGGPSGWWVTGGAVLVIGALLWMLHRAGARSFVQFTPESPPVVTPKALPANAKVPVYVTGWLSVQTKMRKFAGTPGFYRTFATREHALMCQVRGRRFALLATWPPEEEGLWYAFVEAQQIDRARTGRVTYGRTELPGLAIDYRLAGAAGGKVTHTTLYLAFPTDAERTAVLADVTIEVQLASA